MNTAATDAPFFRYALSSSHGTHDRAYTLSEAMKLASEYAHHRPSWGVDIIDRYAEVVATVECDDSAGDETEDAPRVWRLGPVGAHQALNLRIAAMDHRDPEMERLCQRAIDLEDAEAVLAVLTALAEAEAANTDAVRS